MKCQSLPFFAAVFALTLSLGLSSLHAAGETVLDTATIEAITGLKGVSTWAAFMIPRRFAVQALLNASGLGISGASV
jgi:hypothetical protein